MSPDEVAELPEALFAFPGPLRDRLVAAILEGTKTATTSLLAGYTHDDEPLPEPGGRSVLVDSAGRGVAVLEDVAARVARLADVPLVHVVAEGEGHRTVARWRTAHEGFWHSTPLRESLADPGFTVDDDTLVVLETFRVVDRLAPSCRGSGPGGPTTRAN